MKAYKCILPFVALFLVHGASATFGSWDSAKIKDLIEYKINRLKIPFIFPRNPLLIDDYSISKYYFLKPASSKSIYTSNNNPANINYIFDVPVYDSTATDTQKSDISNVNSFPQYESTYVYPNINSDNAQASGLSNIGISEEYGNGYIYPTVNSDNVQVDGVSYVQADTDTNVGDNKNCKCGVTEDLVTDTKLESVESNDEDSVNPESGIVIEIVGESGFIDPESDTIVIDADDSSVIDEDTISQAETQPIIEDAEESSIIDKDIISEADTEPVLEDVEEMSFADAEPDSGAAEIYDDGSDYFYSDDETIDEREKLNNSQSDDHSDIGTVKEYNGFTDTETTTANAINNSTNSSIDYFPEIDIRIGEDNDVEDYKSSDDDIQIYFKKNTEV